MKKKSKRLLCLLLAVLTILAVFPLSVSAACSHTNTKKVHDTRISSTANGHQYMTHCNICGADLTGWGKSGWEAHSFGSWKNGKRSCTLCGYMETCSHSWGKWTGGTRTCSLCGKTELCPSHTWKDNYNGTKVCTICGTTASAPAHTHTWSDGSCSVCGLTCSHSNTTAVWDSRYTPTATGHQYLSHCSTCGKDITGWQKSGWVSHTMVNGVCTVCGWKSSCTHSSTSTAYSTYTIAEHKYTRTCDSCGETLDSGTEAHSYSPGKWEYSTEKKHKHALSCACGAVTVESEDHNYVNGVCTGCGHKKTNTGGDSGGTGTGAAASVTISASGPSGTLNAPGGEIAAKEVPASYTVYASGANCKITKISYVLNGKPYTVNGSSVTITASRETEFTTTAFTAYSDVSGVTASMTVNFKYEKKGLANIMWETSDAAVIRSVSGNGLAKTLSYSMTLPNSYDSQGNLNADQIAALESLIGRNDGKTYTIGYTRTITVYTPAELSSTGKKEVRAVYDGNSSSDITACLSAWGWTEPTKQAIRQAASSSLSFTTSVPVSCNAVWINTVTGRQIHSKDFGSGKSVSASQSASVSVAYSDYSNSGNYVFESLSYSGDTSGTSTSQSYSQTYTASSKALTVTFYCHPKASKGTVTVTAVDGDTGTIISNAVVQCGDKTGSSNPQTFTDLAFATYTVRASADGYSGASGTVQLTQNLSDKAITLKLYRNSGRITVTVKDADTKAVISGASVSGAGKSGSTGSDGTVTFDGAAYDTVHTFTAAKTGYNSNTGTAKVTKEAPFSEITIYLSKVPESGSITVTVKDSKTEKVISGASVSGASKTGTTNSNGTVSFTEVPFGSYEFTASKSGYSSGKGTAKISKDKISDSITIYLDPIPTTGSITVKVVDASTDKVISGATVSGASKSGTTGTSGTVLFSSIPFGSYEFTASRSGYYSNTGTGTISVTQQSITVTIRLTPIPTAGSITVKVVDASTDQVISGASVSGASKSGTTGTSGTVSFSSIPFGTYEFTASKSGYYSNKGSGTISLSGQSTTITIRLTPIPTSGDITVTVRDKDSNAVISGASVVSGSLRGTTDRTGSTVFRDLPFKTYTFTASASGYESGTGTASISETKTAASVTIYLEKIRTDLTVDGEINGTVYKGSTIMVSAVVSNNGAVNLTPDRPASVVMTLKNTEGHSIGTQTKAVIIPANDSNLVWFSVTIPDTASVRFEFRVSAPSGVSESDLANNIDAITASVYDLPIRNCDDAGMSTEMPKGYTYTQYTGNSTVSRSWSVWEWNGGFVKKSYTAKLSLSASLIPDTTAGYRRQSGSVWTTRSGYGVDTSVGASVVSESSAIAGTLKIDTFYPEHSYSDAAKKSDRLENVSGKYVFKVLASSVSSARMHTVPLWFPDGSYSVKYYAYDVWCPAGMLSGYTNAKVTIDGDMYDDLWTK